MRSGFGVALLAAAVVAPCFAQDWFYTPDAGNQLQLLETQFHSGSYIGVRLSDIDNDRAKTLGLGEPRGVEVTQVEPGSPAEQVALKPGDVLLTYNGESILGAQHLGRLVSETPVGRRITIQYWRDGKTQSATVKTASNQPRFLAPNVFFDSPDTRKIQNQIRAITLEVPSPLMVWKNSMMGIEGEPLDSQLAHYFGVTHGVLVRSVESESSASKAGIRAGDVITTIEDHQVDTPRDLASFARYDRQMPKKVRVALVRDHKGMNVEIPIPDQE